LGSLVEAHIAPGAVRDVALPVGIAGLELLFELLEGARAATIVFVVFVVFAVTLAALILVPVVVAAPAIFVVALEGQIEPVVPAVYIERYQIAVSVVGIERCQIVVPVAGI